MLTKKNLALGLLLVTALIIFILGAYLVFFWMKGTVGQGDYTVEGGDVLQLSWYLEKGDRTEGGFTVSGGNREIRFYIENPSGAVIHDAGIVTTQHWHGFIAGNSGKPTLYIKRWKSVKQNCKITVKVTYISDLMVNSMVNRGVF